MDTESINHPSLLTPDGSCGGFFPVLTRLLFFLHSKEGRQEGGKERGTDGGVESPRCASRVRCSIPAAVPPTNLRQRGDADPRRPHQVCECLNRINDWPQENTEKRKHLATSSSSTFKQQAHPEKNMSNIHAAWQLFLHLLCLSCYCCLFQGEGGVCSVWWCPAVEKDKEGLMTALINRL